LVTQVNLLDDDTSNDDISADMFVALCRHHGFIVSFEQPAVTSPTVML
jgi:hypothetical protein